MVLFIFSETRACSCSEVAFKGYSKVVYSKVLYSKVVYSKVVYPKVAYSKVAYSEIVYSKVVYSDVAYSEVAYSEVVDSKRYGLWLRWLCWRVCAKCPVCLPLHYPVLGYTWPGGSPLDRRKFDRSRVCG